MSTEENKYLKELKRHEAKMVIYAFLGTVIAIIALMYIAK